MYPTPEPRDPARDELQMQLLGHKTFVVTLVGSVAFLITCIQVLMS